MALSPRETAIDYTTPASSVAQTVRFWPNIARYILTSRAVMNRLAIALGFLNIVVITDCYHRCNRRFSQSIVSFAIDHRRFVRGCFRSLLHPHSFSLSHVSLHPLSSLLALRFICSISTFLARLLLKRARRFPLATPSLPFPRVTAKWASASVTTSASPRWRSCIEILGANCWW